MKSTVDKNCFHIVSICDTKVQHTGTACVTKTDVVVTKTISSILMVHLELLR